MVEDIIDYVRVALEGFDNDPADTDFQRGYRAALKVIWHECLKQPDWDRVPFK